MGFEFDGEIYKNASTHQKEWGAKLIAGLNLQGTEHILDLGSGDGALTAQLAALVPDGRVVGIDSSLSMIEAARAHEGANLQFDLCDINEMAYESEFDVAFSNAALHWVHDHHRLLGRAFRALKPGGILRFNFAADGNCATFNRVVQELTVSERYAGCFRGFAWPWYMPPLDDYRILASQFPFRELKVWGENADRHFPDAGAMIKWIDQPSLVPFLLCVPEVGREGFRNEVVERMVRAAQQEDGRCFETFQRINLFARK